MQILSYITLTVSIIFLYWCSFIAYDKSVRISPIDELPVFSRQNCIVQHIETKQEDSSLHDLSIYYSGVKKPEHHENEKLNHEQKVEDEKIQQEILKIIKEKQKSIEENKAVQKIEKIIPSKIKEKIEIAKKKPKNIVTDEDDTFTTKRKSSKKSVNKQSSNVFDVIE